VIATSATASALRPGAPWLAGQRISVFMVRPFVNVYDGMLR
jgi:hypothetical protein